MVTDNIVVTGAREHNLKSVDVSIPRNRLVVITGVSGSGKSSLAFDTIYAEGRRRYVESLSTYARQFLGRMEKPNVENIEGLSPAISIDQKGVSNNPRSTVGTVTEIYDYLRLLYARAGRPHCHLCGRAVQKQTVQQIVDSILNLPTHSRIMIMAPMIVRRKGEHKEVFELARKAGYVRVLVDGILQDLSEDIILNPRRWHTIELVIDRLVVGESAESSRVSDSVEQALKFGNGVVQVNITDGQELLFSETFSCPHCGISIGEIEPRTFSFNSPHGACPDCTGLGFKLEVDPDFVIPNKELSLSEGAITPWRRGMSARRWYANLTASLASAYGFSTRIPVKEMKEEHLRLILYGNDGQSLDMSHRTRRGQVYSWKTTFEGVIPNLQRRYKETDSDYMRSEIEKYMASRTCTSCQGNRLRVQSLSVKVADQNIMQVAAMTVGRALDFVEWLDKPSSDSTHEIPLNQREQIIADQILKEIMSRLHFLKDVGLGYLTLDRSASTLSGGEGQRIRLATQIGSGLIGVLYVCDEPSVGLHPVDNDRLISTLKNLRDIGNTVIIVEHDESIMRSADHIIDMGPGAGDLGGMVVATGTVDQVMASSQSITGQYLSGARKIPQVSQRRGGNGLTIDIIGAKENNLKGIDVSIPLAKLVCVTGVSGSGKSSLISEVLYKKLSQLLYNSRDKPGYSLAINGVENIDKIVNIDQMPIGRTPRSNPATYTGAFTPIRELFAAMPESKVRGYTAGRFSFNVKGGRCEACMGGGYIQIEMQFLPDVTVPCETCNGQRYNREALEVTFKDKTIADVLNMRISESLDLFWNFPRVRSKLESLNDVGLGYIKLGQPATTLSGGEAQRVKLATELSKRATGKTFYVLDEPTTGLSFEDCGALLRVLHRLVDVGNTVVLIEHNLDMIRNADWIIDMGPGAGEDGGYVIAVGIPEDVARVKKSHTGKYLEYIFAQNAQDGVGAKSGTGV